MHGRDKTMPQPKTDKSGQIQPRSNKANTLVTLVDQMAPQIARALPKHMTPDRMARVVLTALRINPQLAQTTRESFAGCIMSCAQLGLEPNTPLGQAYLIPRKNKKLGTLECTMIIGYQGYVDLAHRAHCQVTAEAVREGDLFEYGMGLNPYLNHVPSDLGDREDKPITHAYAIARPQGMPPFFKVLSRAQIEARRKRGGNRSYSPWDTDYEAMACKCSVRAMSRFLPKSVEISQALAIDIAAETERPQSTIWAPQVVDALEQEGLVDADGVVIEEPGAVLDDE